MNTAAVISWLSHWPVLWVPLSLTYAGLIGTMALTAVFAATPARRKAALEVLRLLLPGRRRSLAEQLPARKSRRRRDPSAIEPPNP
jgi:hypothetical protein